MDPSVDLTIAELRGHGGSWPPPSKGSVEQFTSDVLSVADKVNYENFFVGGHSIGGMTAMEVASEEPQRVLGVISIEGWTNAHAAHLFNRREGDPEPKPLPPLVETMRNSVQRHWTPQQIEAFGRIWRSWDGTSFLETTSLPVLELWGDRGRSRPMREHLLIPRRPNIELVWIRGASHYLPLEAPAEVAAAINRFVAGVVERAGSP